jgi:Co/Zn/Cd efflux system component
MGSCCHTNQDANAPPPKTFQRLLIATLVINAVMFVVEISAGLTASAASRQANAFDFLGDSANYSLFLCVLGMSLWWRAGAALVKDVSMGLFGLFVIANAAWHANTETLPGAMTMDAVGTLALIANVICALLLMRFRDGDANMSSIWLCIRNDATGNLEAIMASLALSASWRVITHALRGLRYEAGILPTPLSTYAR